MPGIILLNKDVLLISVLWAWFYFRKVLMHQHGDLFLGNTTGGGDGGGWAPWDFPLHFFSFFP